MSDPILAVFPLLFPLVAGIFTVAGAVAAGASRSKSARESAEENREPDPDGYDSDRDSRGICGSGRPGDYGGSGD